MNFHFIYDSLLYGDLILDSELTCRNMEDYFNLKDTRDSFMPSSHELGTQRRKQGTLWYTVCK